MIQHDDLTKLLRAMAQGDEAVRNGHNIILNSAADRLEDYERSLEDQEQSFDLRWRADIRAIKRWQKEHPDHDLTWPDHVDLVVWLMEQLDGMRKVMDGHDAA